MATLNYDVRMDIRITSSFFCRPPQGWFDALTPGCRMWRWRVSWKCIFLNSHRSNSIALLFMDWTWYSLSIWYIYDCWTNFLFFIYVHPRTRDMKKWFLQSSYFLRWFVLYKILWMRVLFYWIRGRLWGGKIGTDRYKQRTALMKEATMNSLYLTNRRNQLSGIINKNSL